MAGKSAKFKRGGKVFYDGGSSKVAKEAVQKKASGGKVCAMPGGKSADRRARGGAVGADKSPYSSAYIKG